jgi:hypothetical protein
VHQEISEQDLTSYISETGSVLDPQHPVVLFRPSLVCDYNNHPNLTYLYGRIQAVYRRYA